jgi:hypothetical protein
MAALADAIAAAALTTHPTAEMAVVEAAQKARSFEETGQTEEAETWRGIEAALKLMRGPHVS